MLIGITVLIIAGIYFATSSSLFSVAKSDIYTSTPPCIQSILNRQEWFKPEVFSKTDVSPPTGLALFLSSKTFAGTETIAITLPSVWGATIYLTKPEYFDPYTIDGVSYWAHELKHAQQILKLGNYGFIQSYLADYLSRGGYSTRVTLEQEASTFQEEVRTHLTKESAYNEEKSWCLKDQNYSPNPYWKEIPLIDEVSAD